MMPAEHPRSANRHHQLFSPLPITRHSQKSELSILAYRSYPLSTFINASTLHYNPAVVNYDTEILYLNIIHYILIMTDPEQEPNK